MQFSTPTAAVTTHPLSGKSGADQPPQAPRPDPAGEPRTLTRPPPEPRHPRPAGPAQEHPARHLAARNPPRRPPTRNVSPKREDKCRSNVKTTSYRSADSNREPPGSEPGASTELG